MTQAPDPASPAEGRPQRQRRAPRPLDAAALDELALAYVGRFATSRARLARYLDRKLRERGWAGEGAPDVAAVVGRLADYRYVDDAAYAESSARSLVRRGYGGRRVASALFAAGISEEDGTAARAIVQDQRIAAALRLAEKRRWGPYASEVLTDPALREKRIATFIRAGHDARLARAIIGCAPGETVEWFD